MDTIFFVVLTEVKKKKKMLCKTCQVTNVWFYQRAE